MPLSKPSLPALLRLCFLSRPNEAFTSLSFPFPCLAICLITLLPMAQSPLLLLPPLSSRAGPAMAAGGKAARWWAGGGGARGSPGAAAPAPAVPKTHPIAFPIPGGGPGSPKRPRPGGLALSPLPHS